MGVPLQVKEAEEVPSVDWKQTDWPVGTSVGVGHCGAVPAVQAPVQIANLQPVVVHSTTRELVAPNSLHPELKVLGVPPVPVQVVDAEKMEAVMAHDPPA